MEHRQHTRKIKFVKYLTNLWSPQCTSTDNNFADCRTSTGFYNLSLGKIPNSVEHRNSNLTNQPWKKRLPIEQKGFIIYPSYRSTVMLLPVCDSFLLQLNSWRAEATYSSWIAWFRVIGFNLFAAVIISTRMLTDEERVKRWRKALSWMVVGSYRVIFHNNFL